MTDIAGRLLTLLNKQTGKSFEQLDASSSLEELGIDSFDFIEFLFLVEDEFDIDLNYRANDFGSKVKTVGDLVAMVTEMVGTKEREALDAAAPSAL